MKTALGLESGRGMGIGLLLTNKVPDGARLILVPAMVTSPPPGSKVAPAIEIAVGSALKV